MDATIKLSKVKEGWKAERNNVTGIGKTKKQAIADLEETERFLKIIEK